MVCHQVGAKLVEDLSLLRFAKVESSAKHEMARLLSYTVSRLESKTCSHSRLS